MSPEEMAWAAGLFEGEGSVRINKQTSRNACCLLVDVPNTNLEIISFFAERGRGAVASYKPRGFGSQFWRWRASSRNAAAFLNDVLPYLRTVRYRERALLGLEFQAQKRAGRKYDGGKYAAVQVGFYERMKALNGRGTEQGRLFTAYAGTPA